MKKKKIEDDLSNIQLADKWAGVGIGNYAGAYKNVKKKPNESISESRVIPKNAWDDLRKEAYNKINKAGYKYSDIASEALKTQAEREKDYGPADRNHENIAKIWSVLLFKKLKVDITKEDVALLFCGAKLAREANEPKKDNLVDAVAYLGILDGFHGVRND